MNDDELAKDPLDKLSGQLRKAVGQNRHEMGGLRSIVSQMKKDRNRSVGLLSKKQQDLLQKQAKLLPAISMKRKSRKISNQVIPLSQEIIGLPMDSHIKPKLGSIGPNNSTQFNVLPPIRSGGNSTRELSSTEKEAKLRRISDYQKEFSSLQESLNNAHKFASSTPNEDIWHSVIKQNDYVHEEKLHKPNYRRLLQSLREKELRNDEKYSRTLSDELSMAGREKPRPYQKCQKPNNDIDTVGTDEKRKRTPEYIMSSINEVASVNAPLLGTLTNVEIYKMKESKKKKKNYWDIVRQNLGFITSMNKQNHSKYYEQLFQEIRKCRYIRKPRKRNPSTGQWYESGEESENEESNQL